jgi:hypothetical protein
MATRKEASCRRSPKCRVTIDPGDPEAGRGGVVPLDAIERGDGRAAKPILDRIWPPAKQEARQAIELHFDAQDRDA